MEKKSKSKKQLTNKSTKSLPESGRTGAGLKMDKGDRDKVSQSTKKERYESIILSVMSSVHRSIDLQEVMDNAIDAMRENIKAIEHLGIYIVEGEEAVLRAQRGIPNWFYKRIRRIPYPKGFIWNTIIRGKPRYVPDVDNDDVIGPAGKRFGTKSYLCVPIQSNGKTVGVLGIASLVKNAFDHDELKLLEIIAHQIETAMNNARQAEELKNLSKELRHRNKDLETLNTINQTVHKFHDLEQVFQTALDMTEGLGNVDMTMIYLVEEDRKEAVLQAYRNLPQHYIKRASRIPYPKGVTWKVINSGKILNIQNAQQDPNIGPAGRKLGHHGVLGIPIKLENKTIGVVWFCSDEQRKYDAQEVELFSSIGYQIATAIAKAKLYRELMLKNRYESIVSSVLRSIYQSIDLQEVLENAVESLSKNIEKLDISAIYLVEDNEAVLKSHRGYSRKYLSRASRIPHPKGATWKTIIDGKSRYVPDVDKDKHLGPAGRETGMKSYLSVPIRFRGNAVGALNLVSFQTDAFDKEDLKLLETVAEEIEIAINNARQANDLRESEKRFHTIADTAPVMIWLSRPDNVKTYFNKFWLEFTGRKMEQELGDGWVDNVHPGDLERAVSIIEPAYAEKKEFKLEIRLRRFDGEYRWILVHGIPRTHADGGFAGFIGSCVDITERKRVEESLAYKKKELVTTLNSMANSVITTNTKGSVTFMNSLAESLTGWKNNDAIEKKLAGVLKLKDIETMKRIKLPREAQFKSDAPLALPPHAILIGNNGEEKAVDIGISKLRDEEGNISGNVFILRESRMDKLASIDDPYADDGAESYPGNAACKPVSVMIAASSVIVVEGVSRIFESAKSINVTTWTSDPENVIPLLLENKPDVLFFDTALGSPDIPEILKSLRKHEVETKLLLLVQETDERSIIDAVSLGVRGCITEPSNREQLIQAVRAVGNDEIWLDVGLVTQILTRLIPKEEGESTPVKADLTKKEEEIVNLVLKGMGNKQISRKLYISEMTVKTHLRNTFKKLGIHSRYELIKKFGSHGLNKFSDQ